MSSISRPNGPATDGQVISSDYYNADLDTIYNDHNGGITNANIAADAAIAESKIAFGGNSGEVAFSDGAGGLTYGVGGTAGQVLKSDGAGGLTYGGSGRAFAWTLQGTLATGNAQGASFIVPQNMTATKLWGKTKSGTCTIRIKDNASTVASLACTSTVSSTETFSDNSLAAGSVVSLDITAASSGVDVYVTLECVQD